MNKNFRKGMSKTLVCLLATSMATNMHVPTAKAQESVEQALKNAIYKNINSEFSSNKKFAGVPKVEKQSNDNIKVEKEDPNEVVRVIVQLEAPSAADVAGKGKATTSQINAAKAAQLPIMTQVRKLQGATIRHSYGNVLNGFSVEVKRGDIKKIEELSGVKKVTEVEKYYADMNSAKDLTQALDTWKDYGYQGEGMLISIIDTGIDFEHKDMRLNEDGKSKVKLNPASVQEKINALGKGKYFSEKVPFGYNYADKNITVKDTTASMHGMHVAGIAAANGTEEEVKAGKAVQGVAPDAQLLAMKVFSNGPLSAGAYTDDIVAAIEDSVTLGADVINMSLGSSAGFQDPTDPEQIAIEKATDAGVVVVVSAGNSQYSTAPYKFNSMKDVGLVGSPGIAKDTLQVANFENNMVTSPSLTLNVDGVKTGSFGYTESDVKVHEKLDQTKEYEVVYCGLGGTEEDFKDKDLNGKIALIERGAYNFVVKKLNAQAHGAAGVIVYNSAAGGESYINMASDPSESIPGLFIKRSSGVAIKTALDAGKAVKLVFGTDTISEANGDAGDFDSSTSWGTAPSLDFKPEIAAPGGDIYSTVNNNKYETMSGTSMAAPHASGAEALIVQAIKKNNPELKGRDLSRLARFTSINTAQVRMDKIHPDTPYSPRRQGAGMIQIEDAIKNRVILTYKKDGNAVTALKEIGKATTFELELENLGSDAVTYNVSSLGGVLTDQDKSTTSMHYVVQLPAEQANVKFDKNSVTVPAKGKVVVKATLTIADAVSSERFMEGFVKFTSETAPDLVMPYIGYYGDWSKEAIINAPAWVFNDPDYEGPDHEYYLPSSMVLTKATFGNSVDYGYLGFDGEDKYENVIIDPETIAISPNGDGEGDTIIPYLYHLRNAKETSVVILDKDGKELGTVATKADIRRKIYNASSGSGQASSILDSLGWDGKIYNPSTGQNEALPEGNYTLDIRSKVDLPEAKAQSFKVPVKIDVTAPQVAIKAVTKIEGDNYKLEWTMEDKESKLAVDGYAIAVNNKVVDGLEPDYDEATKVYSTTLNLKDGAMDIAIAAMDRAFNVGTTSKDVAINLPPAQVILDDEIAGGSFVVTDAETYTIKGELNRPVKTFKIAGKDVQVNDDLTYAHEVSLIQGINYITIYAEDFDGKVVAEYAIKGECDTIAPEILIDMAHVNADNTELTIAQNQDKVEVKGKVSDNTFGYTFFVNGKAVKNASTDVAGPRNNQYSYSEEVAVKEGDIIQLKAVDLYGHETIKSLKVKVDKIAPEVTVTGVEDGKVYEGAVTPKIVVDTSAVTTEVKLNGKDFVSGTEIKEVGKYELKITATDDFGNKTEKAINFEIKARPTTVNVNNDTDTIVGNIKDEVIKNVIVDASKNTTVDKSVFEALKGEEKAITFEVGNVTWTFDGKDIKKAMNLDLSLEVVNESLKNEITDKVKDMLESNSPVFMLSFKHDGELPGKAQIKVFMGNEWANKTVSFFRYYSDKDTYEKVQSDVKVDKDGYAIIGLSHCSDYFALEQTKAVTSLPQAGAVAGATNALAVGGIFTALGAAFFSLFKRKEE